MVEITIENLYRRKIKVRNTNRSLLFYLHENRVDWMHACGGKGRCTTCRMIVVDGMQNMGPETAAEIRYRELNALAENERLACQVSLLGDVTIRVPGACKLPHISYSG